MSEEVESKNAIITRTTLGVEDHGTMTYYIHLKYAGSGQGAGGYALGGDFGVQYVRKILETVGVDTWEALPGKHVRVEATWSKVLRIGHIIEDKWMDLSLGVPDRRQP